MPYESIYTAIYDRKRDPQYLGCLLRPLVHRFIQDYLRENPKADLYTQPATQEQIKQEISQ